jgi:hypothetical protein
VVPNRGNPASRSARVSFRLYDLLGVFTANRVNLKIVPSNEIVTGNRLGRKYRSGIEAGSIDPKPATTLGNKETMCPQNFISSSVLPLMI